MRIILVREYRFSPEPRREGHEERQVIGTWNNANEAIFYGKNSELTGANCENQELSVFTLHLPQPHLYT